MTQAARLIPADRCLLVSRATGLIEGRPAASLNLPAALARLLAG